VAGSCSDQVPGVVLRAEFVQVKQISWTQSPAGTPGPSDMLLLVKEHDPRGTVNRQGVGLVGCKNQSVIAPSTRVIKLALIENPPVTKSPELRVTLMTWVGGAVKNVPLTPVVSKSNVAVPVMFVPSNAASASALGLGPQVVKLQRRLVKMVV
jgi:hypothetical protein